jgi:Kef-type K+ transport system membrane component KefB
LAEVRLSDIAIATLLAGTVLLASTISVEIGLSVALIELLAGVIVGNDDHLLGSTADRVAEHADCPVMIVK